jgi:hypothetical protein
LAAWVASPPGPALASGANVIASPDLANVFYSDLELDANGRPVVSYYDYSHDQLKVLHCGDATCSSGNSIAAPDSGLLNLNVQVYQFSLALDVSGNPVVAYPDHQGGIDRLRVLHCGNPDCTSGNVIAVPVTGGGHFLDMAIDGSGFPVISYVSTMSTTTSLNVLHCGDANCAMGNTITSPDTLVSAIWNSSIALDATGRPVVSYYDYGNGDLKVLHCGDATCSAGNTIVSPDTAGNVGRYTSIALDVNGNPVVSYYDFTNQDLKILRCGDPNCSANNIISAPDTGGNVGGYPSLVLDSLSMPVVSYYDITNHDLKVLHCNSYACTAGNVIRSPDTADDVGAVSAIKLDNVANPVVSYKYVKDTFNNAIKVLHCGNRNCAAPPDSDGDGCPDAAEQQTAPGSQTSGGLRDPKNPWDYFNPSHDGQDKVDDILIVVGQYGKHYPSTSYREDTDRTYTGPNIWNLGPPDGQQTVADIIAMVQQYNHNCGP